MVKTSKTRSAPISRPERINAMVGKCNLDQLDELAKVLVAKRRTIAAALSSLIRDELGKAQQPATPIPGPSMPRGPATMELGGVKIPVNMGDPV